jgi:hypothetical protein
MPAASKTFIGEVPPFRRIITRIDPSIYRSIDLSEEKELIEQDVVGVRRRPGS